VRVVDSPAGAVPRAGVRRAGCIFPFLTLLAAAGIVVATLVQVVRLYHPLPFWDQWDFVGSLHWYFDGAYGARDLWSQHNEHRIVVPRLLFFADALWFGGRNVFLIACTLATSLLLAVLLFRAWRAGWRPGGARTMSAAAVVLAAAFSAVQLENLIWGFQVQFVLVYMAAFASFLALQATARARAEGRGGRATAAFALAVLAATVSTLSMANGTLVWPVLVALALVLRLPWRLVALLAALGALLLAAYFTDYRTLAQHRLTGGLLEPHRLLLYAAAYLGGPFRGFGLPVAATLGAVALLAGAVALVAAVRLAACRAAAPAILANVVFLLGTAGATALGRMHFDAEQAMSGRYSTPVLWLWCSLWLWWSRCRPAAGGRAPLAHAAAVAFVALLWSQQGHGVWEVEHRPLRQEVVKRMLQVGTRDDAALAETHGVPPLHVLIAASALREHRLSVFTGNEHEQIGSRALDRYELAPAGRVVGMITAAERIADSACGHRVRGWAWDLERRRPVATVVVLDQRGVIVGLASGGFPLDGDEPGCPPELTTARWQGYAAIAPDGPSVLAACAIDEEGRAHPLTGSCAAHSTLVGVERLGEAIEGPITVEGGFEVDGQPPGVPGLPPPHTAYASWCGSDRRFGKILIGPLRLPATFGVPFLTGPSSFAQRMWIVDMETGLVVAALTDIPVVGDWRVWVCELPPALRDRDLALVAVDDGHRFGQWLGIGLPHHLRPPR